MTATWATHAGIALDAEADVPLGVQLEWGLRSAIHAGRLRAGERLPGLRDLALELGVNHNTLRAAVARLEQEGLLERRHGTGTFVAGEPVAAMRLGAAVQHAAETASAAGLEPRQLAAALWIANPAAETMTAAALERRALRDEIALLDRLVSELEDRLPRRPSPQPAPRAARSGARILDQAALRTQRDELIHRLAEARRALDAEPTAAGDPAAPEPSQVKAPQKRARSPVRRIAPA